MAYLRIPLRPEITDTAEDSPAHRELVKYEDRLELAKRHALEIVLPVTGHAGPPMVQAGHWS
ncbi:hypothetical protein PGT21_004938 [Puccinia graminis f. sp. tritici]|uniref:Uncharacterized protein n=1 Tax=Puccinia graminis f. sp. tritici TaxID=56615 RepID=A0A5B0PQH7_PUCGR|nr:hypothetical protein PGTUg99_022659 [Puccinia graminis f. sp. tritici]KAA1103935.1 hypothetical protein PGT21_004938 [Puccinia graminis f. sp. tritici]